MNSPETISTTTTKIAKAKRKHHFVPVPTHWTRKTPEGCPPTSVLLLIMSWDGEEELPIIDTGYYSDKLRTFLTFDGQAIEADAEVVAYHVVHGLDGEPFPFHM